MNPPDELRRRRAACAAALACLALPCRALAQPAARVAKVGLLIEPSIDAAIERGVLVPFRRGMAQLGYAEGANYVLTARSAAGRNDALDGAAVELLRIEPDVVVAAFPSAAYAAKKATRSVPIVAVSVDDPVAMGLAQTMAKPSGNITGISAWGGEIVAKRLQLLRELVPAGRTFGILIHPPAITGALPTSRWETGINAKIRVYESNGPADMASAFAAMARDRIDGLLVLADGNSYTHRERLNALCIQHRLPSVWGGRDFLSGGALASYQSDFPAMFQRAAALVDAILKGRPPGDIPFEQASKLELVIDRRAARAIGVAVPGPLLVAADHVIE